MTARRLAHEVGRPRVVKRDGRWAVVWAVPVNDGWICLTTHRADYRAAIAHALTVGHITAGPVEPATPTRTIRFIIPTEETRMNPDCLQGKHHARSGTAWDDQADTLTTCTCPCHTTTPTVTPTGRVRPQPKDDGSVPVTGL